MFARNEFAFVNDDGLIHGSSPDWFLLVRCIPEKIQQGVCGAANSRAL
jgi:hypothetical protein